METNIDDLRIPLNPGNPDHFVFRATGNWISKGKRIARGSTIDGSRRMCRLRIRGIKSKACAESVVNALMRVNGVNRAVVGPATEEAKVHFNSNFVNEDKVCETIHGAGFEAILMSSQDEADKVQLQLEEVSSEDMVVIRSYLERAVGVIFVHMDLSLQRVTICYNPDQTDPRYLIQCIKEAGQGHKTYSARLYVPSSTIYIEQLQEIRTYRNLFLLSFLFSIPVVLFAMVLPTYYPYGHWLNYNVYNTFTVGMLLKWIFCTPVQFFVGRRFNVGSYHALRRKSANMDVLVALGTNAAYFYSLYILIKALTSTSLRGQDCFETSCMLISFILLGKYLEAMAKGKVLDALAKLAHLTPATARLMTMDDNGDVLSEMEIDTRLLQRSDIIKIVPGAIIPVDGIVINGESHVNESMITRESRPVEKTPGDKVTGGTVNENECILVKTTHVGVDTTLSKIVQLMESAQLSRRRTPTQKLADQISKVFVRTVVVVASATWLGWLICGEAGIYPKHWIPQAMDEFELALQFGISVLAIACPCALGLAAPTAVMAALGKGASLGVLIKDARTLDNVYKVKTIVFDKTGTLTVGKPKVVSVVLFSQITMEALCDIAIAMESNSEHPLAKSVVEHAKKMKVKFGSGGPGRLSIKNIEVFSGAGIGATVQTISFLVGNRRLMCDHGIRIGAKVDRYIVENECLGQTCILVAINGKIVGGFGVSDPPKPGARAVITFLRSRGISSIMVTGDDWGTARAIGRDVGIDEVYAEINAIGKANKIKALKRTGATVAMVGDGVSESSALAAADVGIALGAGTNIAAAISEADIIITRSNFEDVATTIDLARHTVYRTWLNYIWAVGYNITAVPIAAGMLYPFTGIRLSPWLAGACMAASSVTVVCSSLLLKFYLRPLSFQTTA